MANDRTKRCRFCGGTMWKDGDVEKCFMCSRTADGPAGADRLPAGLGQPKLPGSRDKSAYFKRAK